MCGRGMTVGDAYFTCSGPGVVVTESYLVRSSVLVTCSWVLHLLVVIACPLCCLSWLSCPLYHEGTRAWVSPVVGGCTCTPCPWRNHVPCICGVILQVVNAVRSGEFKLPLNKDVEEARNKALTTAVTTAANEAAERQDRIDGYIK